MVLTPCNYHITQISSMKPPYGTCGESPIDWFDPGTIYSTSRCTQQCSAKLTAIHCGCIDAYMPGMHDDVIKWKRFPHYCPLCGEFTGQFPAQMPVTRSFDVFFDLCLNKRLSKQSYGWWFETPSRRL